MREAHAPRRVLFVINDLARAGAEKQLVELCLGLPRSRYQPHILILKEINHFQHQLAEAHVPVSALGRRGYWDLRVGPRLVSGVRRLRPDVLHSFLFLGNLHAVPVGRLLGVRAVIASQRTSYDASLGRLLRWLARRVHSAADRVITNSLATLKEERAAGAPEHKLVHIPNGVRFRPELPRVDRGELGWPDGPLALSVGQLTADKGHADLVDAWAHVIRSLPEARLVIAGEGPLRAPLEARIRERGLGSRVVLAGARGDVERLLAACDLFVHPSVNEGMPNAVLEAMAAGRPVIGTRAGGIPEALGQSAGTLVPARDPAALAAAVETYLRNPALRRSAGEAGRERSRSEFSVDRMVQRTVDLYETLMTRPRS